MLSKTSCFNKTVYKKDLTRFAPAWGVYLLCLLLGMTLLYTSEGQVSRSFWFAHRMGELIGGMSLINLFYAPLVAQLLFGDLYNSRMGNALHAMPLKREGWFLTHTLAGLTFSIVPTAIMALIAIPLLAGTCVQDAWLIAPIWFLAANLEFVCYFGIALFCTFCVGNRIAMGALYAAVNFGAYIAYWLISCFYSPMLYGVITPNKLAVLLTPVVQMMNDKEYLEMPDYSTLVDLFEGRMEQMVADFRVQECYYGLFIWAGVGILFALVALALYKKRHLECAGDAVAFRWLGPVFQVGCALAGVAAGAMGTQMLEYYLNDGFMIWVFLICGLVVGWFGGKMFLQRSTRVFGPKNWIGLGLTAAVLALSLGLTSLDIFGIEEWTPNPDKVKYVKLGFSDYNSVELHEKADIQEMIRLQTLALEDRLEQSGAYPETAIVRTDKGDTIDSELYSAFYELDSEERHKVPFRYADSIFLTYYMENGREIQRRYQIWADAEEGDIYKEYMSRWEVISKQSNYQNGEYIDLNDLTYIRVDSLKASQELVNRQTAESLLVAVKADCLERNMTQDSYYHDGYFLKPSGDEEENQYTRSLYIRLGTEKGGISFDVYADSRHTLNWLKERGLLTWEVHEENIYPG